MATALYPGGFKPPHRGHFEVVKKLPVLFIGNISTKNKKINGIINLF